MNMREVSIIPLIILVMIFLVSKLLASFWFYQIFHIHVFGVMLQVTGSAFIGVASFVILDFISQNYSRKIAGIILFMGILCDGLFSFGVYFIGNLHSDGGLNQNEIANSILLMEMGHKLYLLYLNGVIATLITYISELVLFNVLIRKVKLFSIASFVSIFVVKSIHTMIVVSGTLYDQANVHALILGNIIVNSIFSVIYILLTSFCSRFIKPDW